MGSYKWSCKSLNIGYNYGYLLRTPRITTRKPPSRVQGCGVQVKIMFTQPEFLAV